MFLENVKYIMSLCHIYSGFSPKNDKTLNLSIFTKSEWTEKNEVFQNDSVFTLIWENMFLWNKDLKVGLYYISGIDNYYMCSFITTSFFNGECS